MKDKNNDDIIVLDEDEVAELSDEALEQLSRGYVTTQTRVKVMKEQNRRRQEWLRGTHGMKQTGLFQKANAQKRYSNMS